MKLLVTGRGTSGSFVIRGEQLGKAIGATVQPNAATIAGFDACIVIKRARPELVQRIHQAGVPLVWDVVDAWPQPHGNEWERGRCADWLVTEVKALRPAAIVAATRAMARDCAAFGVPVIALPHHARPGQALNPLRENVRAVGYQGGDYLGRWRAALEAECARRGWTFVVNPPSLADVDLCVALREANGYAARAWKSNVKLANAQGSGTPIICNREAGYLETASGGEMFADYPGELAVALDSLTPSALRREASATMLAAAPRLETIAAEYSAWLLQLKS